MGNDRTRNRRRNGRIHNFHAVSTTHRAEVLSYAVENNDRLVHRVTQDGEHRRQYRQRELPVHDGEDAHHDHNIVEVGDDGCYRELPLEAEG